MKEDESFCNMLWCNGPLTHPLKHVRWNAAFTNCAHRPPDILFAIEQPSVSGLNHPDMMGIQNPIHALWGEKKKWCPMKHLTSRAVSATEQERIRALHDALLKLFQYVSLFVCSMYFSDFFFSHNLFLSFWKQQSTCLKYFICSRALFSEPSKILLQGFRLISHILRDEEEQGKWG